MFPPIQKRSPMRRTLSQIMRGDQPGKKRHSKIQARVYDSVKQQTVKKERPTKPLKRPPLFPVQLKSPKEVNAETQEYIRAPVFERLQQRGTSAFDNYLTASVCKSQQHQLTNSTPQPPYAVDICPKDKAKPPRLTVTEAPRYHDCCGPRRCRPRWRPEPQ